MPRAPKLGQNFLIDDPARRAIVDALGELRERTVIEIGPGHGAITDFLVSRARRVIAIELDRALAAALRFRYRDQPHIEILEADVLKIDFESLGEQADVVGNLPYYITSDILLHLFRFASLSRAVLMMQREVADRVAAAPGVRDYGLLSATTQMYSRVDKLFTLPPAAFSPPPDVHSTVLRLHFAPRFTELGVEAVPFDAFLKKSFGQKRKTLSNNLRSTGYTAEQLTRAWPIDLPSQARAESVPLEQMAALFRALA